MINLAKFLGPYKEHLSNLREDLKKDVQQLIDKKEINYEQAITILEDSELFKIEDFIIGDGIFDVYTDYASDRLWFNRHETIYFSQISDWINDDYEGCVTEICEEKGVTKEDLQKEIYDTIVNDNIVGFIYDW